MKPNISEKKLNEAIKRWRDIVPKSDWYKPGDVFTPHRGILPAPVIIETSDFIVLKYDFPKIGDFYISAKEDSPIVWISDYGKRDFKDHIVAPLDLSYYDYLVSEESGLRLRAYDNGDGCIYIFNNKTNETPLPYFWKTNNETCPNECIGDAILETFDIKIIPYEVVKYYGGNIPRPE